MEAKIWGSSPIHTGLLPIPSRHGLARGRVPSGRFASSGSVPCPMSMFIHPVSRRAPAGGPGMLRISSPIAFHS